MKTKAAIAIEAGRPLEIDMVNLEGPKDNEVLVEIKSTGVCHTDAYTLSGKDPEGIFPAILGHEGAGIVLEVGKNVKELNMSGTVKPYPDRVDNYFNNIPDHLRKAFVEAYPNIDIDYQLKRAKTWLLANPNRANESINYNNLVVILVTLVIQKHVVHQLKTMKF